MEEIMLKIDHVSKMYKLGQIGGTTLRDELQRKRAKLHGKEDPTQKIGAKDYNQGETFLALDKVSFEVKKGEALGIIGHNGAGKSTLLKLISRVTAPTEGVIGLNGRVASMLEVGTGFHAELTGRENIYMNGAILGMTKKEIDSKMEDIIDFSECRQFIDTPVKRYSSGMYVKLAFSVAAHLDSEIMIMDEVLAVGDANFQKKCIDKMNTIAHNDGRTILYVSHNMNTIRQLCDRSVVLSHGKKIFEGDVEEGIKYYIGKLENDLPVYYEFEKTKREHPSYAVDVIGCSCMIDNKEQAIFQRGEKLKFTLTYRMIGQLPGLKLYFHLHYENGATVGMTFTETDYGEGEIGKKYSATFEMDISNLAPGKYYFNPEICTISNGRHITHDFIPQKINFEVLGEFPNGINWMHRYFGYIKLNELICTDQQQL